MWVAVRVPDSERLVARATRDKKPVPELRFAQYAIVNLSDLEVKFSDGDEVNEESLRALGLVKGRFDGVKVLAKGEVSKKLTVSVEKISATAKEKIEKAGGTATEV